MSMRAALFAIAFLFTSTAFAGDRALAETLFQEARALMDKGNVNEACTKFEQSNKIDPAIGTQLNLATCWEKLGKTASAWTLFTQIATTPNNARAQFAAQRAAQLAPTLSKLTVTAPAGSRVTVDGTTLPAASYGVAVPVDPGSHVIDAVAGDKHFRRTVTVGSNAATVSVVVGFSL